MNELLARIIHAHGGMDRWNRYKRVEATIVSGGGLFPLKGVAQDPSPRLWAHRARQSLPTVLQISARCSRQTGSSLRNSMARLLPSAMRPQTRSPPSDEHALGRATSCLFQWIRPMDLSHHALPSRDGWRTSRGDRSLA